MKRAAENWDAPVILTTNVQFFESIYSNKSSRLRKLHNMAESIIVFDEMHMIPAEYFQPCMAAVEQLVKFYGSTVLFLTATMPDFPTLCEKYCGHKIEMSPLVANKSDFDTFAGCDFEVLNSLCDEEIAELAMKSKNALIVCNSKRRALSIYSSVMGRKAFLSTSMTPKHRSRVIDGIKRDLKNNVGITVVSTSLIEAGVDLDFDAVFRELCGLDSILQSAGRCNREGRKGKFLTYIFDADGNVNSEMGVKQSVMKRLLKEHGSDLRNEKLIESYYDEFYRFKADSIE